LGTTDFVIILVIPLGVVILGIVFGILIPRARRSRQRRQGITLAAFADPSGSVPPRPTMSTPPQPPQPARSPYAPVSREATGTLGADWAEPRPATPAPAPEQLPRLRLEPSGERPFPIPPAVPERPAPPDLRTRLAPADPPPPVRVHRPSDGTLQFLPGRLEIMEGRELGQEIRFIRQPGPGPTEVTFGRQDGVPYRHVQLYEPTVSRLHAKVTQEGTNWRLTNLSRTNPVSVNGTSMAAENASVLLQEGDRIEMGEVVFLFRAK